MVAYDIKAVKTVINRKCNRCNKTAGIKSPNTVQISHVSYRRIIDDIRVIIKLKSAVEGVGINNDSQTNDENNGK